MAVIIESQPDGLSASKNRLYFVVRSDKGMYSSCELTAQVFIGITGDSWEELPIMKLYPTGNGKADVDVSRMIDGRMNPVFPTLSDAGMIKLSGFTLRFKVTFRESYNGTESEVTSQIITVVKGKFPRQQTVTAFVKSGNYLTNGGNIYETVENSVHYLTALFLTAGNYTVNLKAITVDGILTERVIGDITTTGGNEVYAIPVGLKHLSFERPVEQYAISVENSSGIPALNEVTFRVRRMVKRYRSMVYLNVLGGIDTLIITDMSETMKTERESYRADGLRLLSVLTDYTDTFEATTGYITTDAAKQCRELVISDRVYVEHRNSLIAVNIEKGSYKLFTEADDLQALTLKYSFAEQDYPVLNDDGGGVTPDPGPDPEPDPEPEPEKVMACCPDGVDDYLAIKSPTALNLMQIAPFTTGAKFKYTLDMIPNLGYCFSIGRKDLFYLGFMYVGKGLIIQTFYNQKSRLVYQETVADYRDRRVNVELSVENTGTDLLLGLKLNDVAETLTPFDTDDSYKPGADFFNLFQSGMTDQMFGQSKIISFAVDAMVNGSPSRRVLWDFRESTPLANQVTGKTAFDLLANNVVDISEFIKKVSFKN